MGNMDLVKAESNALRLTVQAPPEGPRCTLHADNDGPSDSKGKRHVSGKLQESIALLPCRPCHAYRTWIKRLSSQVTWVGRAPYEPESWRFGQITAVTTHFYAITRHLFGHQHSLVFAYRACTRGRLYDTSYAWHKPAGSHRYYEPGSENLPEEDVP